MCHLGIREGQRSEQGQITVARDSRTGGGQKGVNKGQTWFVDGHKDDRNASAEVNGS